MGYNDDWENLMNSVFGPGGRMRTGGKGSGEKEKASKSPVRGADPDSLNKALLEQQRTLDALLKKQNKALKAQDTATAAALEDSRQLLRDMEADGLLAQGTADTPAQHLGSFEGLAAQVKQTVLGQDAYVDSLVRAMRRPFVLGTEGEKARSVLLIWGPAGTGRHFALRETARLMAARGLLQSDKAAQVDLALYPDPGTERLFLQDLYAALNAPGEMVLFEHYESCCPAFLRTLADLAVKGAAPLASRYLVNREGILVDAGSALAAGAVSRITPRGKYLIFFSHKGAAGHGGKAGGRFCSGPGGRVPDPALYPREPAGPGRQAAERAGPALHPPASPDLAGRPAGAGLCGGPGRSQGGGRRDGRLLRPDLPGPERVVPAE